MKQTCLLIAVFLISAFYCSGQVGINTDGSQPNSSAILDAKSTTKGFLPPRMTTLQRDAINSPATGLVIFNIDCSDIQYFNGSGWVPMGNTGMITPPDSITGNSSPCPNSTGMVYSILPVPDATGYNWTVPKGAIILNGQGTSSITVNFGFYSGFICVAPYGACIKGEMICKAVNIPSSASPSVTIVGSAIPLCEGTPVTFTAIPTNGGANPQYQWKVNNVSVTGATEFTFTYMPSPGESVQCVMIPSDLCYFGNPAYSNILCISVNPLPASPTPGSQVPSQAQIIWNWNPVMGATGYKWNTTNQYSTAEDMGPGITKIEQNLLPNTGYTRYVWAYNSCGNSAVVMLNSQTLGFTIGQTFGGGIIFYIDATEQHGLISAPNDQGQGQWGCLGYYLGGTSPNLGTGMLNTEFIMTHCGNSVAAQLCSNLILNGFDDWFLPSKDELNQLYLHKNMVGSFLDGHIYWSSSEHTPNDAWYQIFDDGSQNYGWKNGGYNVIAIRAF